MIQENIYDAQLDLLHNPKSSDLTVKCKEREWRCQSVILSPRCEFFAAVYDGGFKESHTRTIELHDDDPEGVEHMLEYIYTLHKPDFAKYRGVDLGLKLLVLADKYNIPGLRHVARRNVILNLNGLKSFGAKTDDEKIMDIALIERAWTYNSEERKTIVSILLQGLVNAHAAITHHEGFQNLLRSNQELWLAYTGALSQRLGAITQQTKTLRTGVKVISIECDLDVSDYASSVD